jgi:hypothetical protein
LLEGTAFDALSRREVRVFEVRQRTRKIEGAQTGPHKC